MPPQRRKSGPVGPARRRPKIAGSTRARSSDPSVDRPEAETPEAETPAAESPAAESPAAARGAAATSGAETSTEDASSSDTPADRDTEAAGPESTGSDLTRDTADDAADATPDEAPVARVSATASSVGSTRSGTRSMRRPLVIGAVAVILAVVAVVAAFRPGADVSNTAWVDAAATREVTDAAKHAIEAMHGYNYETIDEDFAEIRSLLTPERLEEFDATAEVTKQAAIQTHTVTEVNVLHIGTSVLDESQAEVAAYINVSATGDGIAQGSAQAPVLVRMQKTDGNWLVSEIRDR